MSVADEELTPRRPEPRQSCQRLTWLGHSTVLLELGGVRLLTDPVGRGRVFHLRRVGEALRFDPRLVDAVLISHVHYDHLDVPSLQPLRRSSQFVVPRGAGSWLRRRGFSHVIETHAEHESRRGPFGVETPAIGYLVSGSSSTYFAGDTDLFAGMGSITDHLDVALLPVAGWGPRLPPGHLDPRSAAEALSLLRPRIAVPIHWGTYRRLGLSRDPLVLREPAEQFARLAAELMPEVEVCVLPIGGSVDIGMATKSPRSLGGR